jgi:uncharacterized protein (TIGR00255 family)
MVRSMTGYGTAQGLVGTTRVAIEVRSVNHRFFSPSIKLPGGFARWESDVREALRSRIARGHVSVTGRAEAAPDEAGLINELAFGRAVERLRALRERYVLAGDVDLGTVLRVPGVLATESDEDPETTPQALVALVNVAVDALIAMRTSEGARLSATIEDRLAIIENAAQRLTARAPERIEMHRTRIRDALAVLAVPGTVDENRLAQEVALLAERVDVGEELDRFQSHLVAFRDTLRASGPDPVGKRLGFLLQEMLREANTTGSKASDAAMQRDVVLIKEELERIREQVENLE